MTTIQSIETSGKPLRICVEIPELYDRIYVTELKHSPHDLYGATTHIDNLLKNSEEFWTPISKEDAKKYDIIIERSITQNDRFVIIKLEDKMREDIK